MSVVSRLLVCKHVKSFFCLFGTLVQSLQCFDAVGWAAGRASGL